MEVFHNIDAQLGNIDAIISNIDIDTVDKNDLMKTLDDIESKIEEFDNIIQQRPKLQRTKIISEFP